MIRFNFIIRTKFCGWLCCFYNRSSGTDSSRSDNSIAPLLRVPLRTSAVRQLHYAKGLFSQALAIRETEGSYDHIQAKKNRASPAWLRKCEREIEVTQSKGMRPSTVRGG